MTVVFEGDGHELAEAAAEWILEEARGGTKLFALEALMSAGKTTVCKQIRSFDSSILHVELDNFHDPRGAAKLRTWNEAFMIEDAANYVRQTLATRQIVLIEGAICWPTASVCGVDFKRIYMKRMQFPGFWADMHELSEVLDEKLVLRRSIRDHHSSTEPWLNADLVLERLIDGASGA